MDLSHIDNPAELYKIIVEETKKIKEEGKDTFIGNTFFITSEQELELAKYLNIKESHPLLTPYGWADLYGEFR